MGNPHPVQTEEFKRKRFQPVGEVPPEKLHRTPVAVTVGESIYRAIQQLDRPARITWLRRVITNAAKRDLMGDSPPGDVLALLSQLEQTRLTKRQREIVAAIRQWLCETKG
ncbi:MAG: hypothetical protein NZ821_06830 [Gloeomargarita sp. SKYB31]|nr:hypothetical protein [Gloeomargarita sp. SKYG98]MCS7226686.1 hypothetical protein [Gloeomargarita sp. SKYB31]